MKKVIQHRLSLILVLMAIIIFLFAGILYYTNHQEEWAQAKEEKEQQELYASLKEENSLEKAKSINPQVIAWLQIPDTTIDFPILQCEDNEHYLYYNLENKESKLGVPFLDYRCQSDFSDFHSIIYGHHISQERMFTPLVHFKEKDYFYTHNYAYLTTSTNQYKIHFIACLLIENDSSLYQTVFLTNNDKREFLNNIKNQAIQKIDFSIDKMIDQKIITLSTCSYEFKNARTVVIGYLESEEK